MAAPSTHRATVENGPNVVDGRLIWTSATGITTADRRSYAGCERRWWYEQVADEKGPPTAAMLGGTALHAEIENHLRGAGRLTTPLALAGSAFIPQPGISLSIERPIHFKTKVGVDIYGHVDLYNFRQEYIDPDGVLQRDPSWSFEVKDWKTTADFQYAKSPRELAENIQLVTYSEAGFRFAPDMEHARHTHVYFRTRGRPDAKLVTIRNTREEIAARWEYAESVVRLMVDVARERTVETVPGNRRSCDAYRGCPHRSKCSVYKHNALDGLFAKVASDHLQEKNVGIIANSGLMQQNTPVTQQQLAAEEQQMRAQVAQQQQQMPMAGAQGPTNAGADLLTVCYRLSQYGFGFPKLVGNAAQAYAAASGQSVAPGFEFQGVPAPIGATRSLHTLPLSEVAHIYQIDGELAAERAKTTAPMLPPMQPQPIAPLTPQTIAPGAQAGYGPTPDHQIQGAPNPAFYPSVPRDMIAPTQFAQPFVMQQGGTPRPIARSQVTPVMGVPILAPGTPESMPQLAQQNTAPPAAPEAEKPKKTRGRPKAEATGTAPEAVAPSSATQTAAASALPQPVHPPVVAAVSPQVTPAAGPTYDTTGALESTCVLVNARFAGKATKSLAPYVDYINSELSKRYSVDDTGKPGIQDVRCVPKSSPLAFGGWKGAVREVVKADPPPEDLYHLDTFADDLNEAVADALRVVAEQRGWMYVRAVRG